MDTRIKIRKIDKKIFLVSVLALLVLPTASASLLNASFVDVNGNELNLTYDTQTQSYADGSNANPNVFVKICASDPSDLSGKFVGLAYKVGWENFSIHILPTKLPISTSSCQTTDLDISFLTARYPGIPVVLVSDWQNLSNASYVELSNNTFLQGQYQYNINGGNNKLKVQIQNIVYNNASPIAYVGPYILIGVLNSSGVFEDVKRVRPDNNSIIELNWSKDNNSLLVINGLKYPIPSRAMCGNGICESGEDWQNCPNDCPPPPPSGGVVFGYSVPFECKWLSTYDGEARPDKPITLLYTHECTYLRSAEIRLSAPVINARILTIGNESNISGLTKPYGTIFGYFSFEHNIPKEKFSKITIQFKLPKALLKEKGFTTDDVKLERFEPKAKTWIELPTKFVAEDTQYYYFESASDSMSTFVILAYKQVTLPTKPTPIEEEKPKLEVKKEEKVAFPFLQASIILLATLLILLSVGYYLYRRGLREEVAAPKPEVPKPEIKPEVVTPVPIHLCSLPEIEQKLEKIRQELGLGKFKIDHKIEEEREAFFREKATNKKIRAEKPMKKSIKAKKLSPKLFEDVEKKLK
ncbi:MAG: PGF-pre-PGF domain-containing protein [Candidatus Nanoarchaeia archaeon]